MEDHIEGTQVMFTSIDLSNNSGIQVNFKSEWAALKTLKSLDCSNTSINGNPPDGWNGMASIETIRFTNTLACRNLPDWNMTMLTTVDPSNNNLRGNLASSWCGVANLASVILAGNTFCGFTCLLPILFSSRDCGCVY